MIVALLMVFAFLLAVVIPGIAAVVDTRSGGMTGTRLATGEGTKRTSPAA